MAKVYVINDDGSTEPMDTIHCKNEELELQQILENNPDLIPGDQISSSDPRRWLLVKREMPVPDPSTGGDRWSVDMFLVDQDAIPTFVECKRYSDTRARREVVGQMLEYAANGHYYWSSDEMRAHADQAAVQRDLTLDEEMKRLQPEDPDSAESFFQRVQDNLRQGQVRLIFFMEEAPQELKSLVDFLNKQMERSEVLLVEARQYEYQGTKIVNPILFGYTEEARQIKKAVTVTSGDRKVWSYESFFENASDNVSDSIVSAMRDVFDKSQELQGEIRWGTGKVHGSFSAKWPRFGRNPVFAVYSTGSLVINFGSFSHSKTEDQFRTLLKEKVVSVVGLQVPEDYERRYPNYAAEVWTPKISELLRVLEAICAEFSPSDAERV